MNILLCAVTGAIPGDGGACGSCEPCILGEPNVPQAVKRLIGEKASLAIRNGELQDEINRLRDALQEIWDCRIGSQPIAMNHPHEQWLERCHTTLRLMAKDALEKNQ